MKASEVLGNPNNLFNARYALSHTYSHFHKFFRKHLSHHGLVDVRQQVFNFMLFNHPNTADLMQLIERDQIKIMNLFWRKFVLAKIHLV